MKSAPCHQKIIFLDIDGVLGPMRDPMGLSLSLSSESIGWVNQLCKEHRASVVLISNQLILRPASLREILRSAGLDAPFHEDWRIDDPQMRGPAIERWCANHGLAPEDYAIIDDQDRSFSFGQQLRLVRPDTNHGVALQDFLKASALLGKELGSTLEGPGRT